MKVLDKHFSDTILHTDMMGREVAIPNFPKRIVSLVPSQTEYLYYLGLGDRLVGQTIFCIHPEQYYKSANKIGGTKKLRLDAIRKLCPDLIIGNKEENDKKQIEELEKEFSVWMSDILTLEDAFAMMLKIGEITNEQDKARTLIGELKSGFKAVQKVEKTKLKTLYLIWRKPWMAAGNNTFINSILSVAGYQNVCKPKDRYPVLKEADLLMLNPELVLLSSEPYPFNNKHIGEIAKLLPDTTIKLVDGELFSWYGNRLLHTIDFLKDKQ